jgi:hypothetical protein
VEVNIMPELPGHERREERRERRSGRRENIKRLIHAGEEFLSSDLDDGEAELDEVDSVSTDLTEEEEAEPWATTKDLPGFREELHKYREFLREWRESHPGEDLEDDEVTANGD